MARKTTKLNQAGIFTVSPGEDIYGQLTVARAETSLSLHHNESFNMHDVPHIHGVLHDLTKVSLIDCISPGVGSGSRGSDRYYLAKVFPHYVAYGDRHIAPDEKIISEAQFVIDDATPLFYDFDAFGSVINAQSYINEIVRANPNREIAIGEHPVILYFTGKHRIFTANTVLGQVSASHSPRHNFGGPEGVWLKNTIFLSIAFEEHLTFEDVINRILTLNRYLGLLVGRPQNIKKVVLRLPDDGEMPVVLKVYWSLPPRRDPAHETRKPHPGDVLIQAARHPEQFSQVLENWLGREKDWSNSRARFSNSFAHQRNYIIDRLIGAANMFDILPSSAVSPDVTLSDDLKNARSASLELFSSLPKSPERDSVLSTLGRIGKSSLKQKIRYRCQFVTNIVGERFPEILRVIDEAVNCRNYFVHGGETRFDYDKHSHVIFFFIDTLEFVFAASDLIECGWDIKSWIERPSSVSHPFGGYRISYIRNLQKFRAAFPQRK